MVAQVDAGYLRYGFGRLARRMAGYALFEGRPATTRGQWFNPVIFGWLDFLGKLFGNPAITAPIFITGLGRSGTTILGMLLSLHRDVGFLNEPKAIWHLLDPRQDLNANYSSAGGLYRLGASDVTADMRNKAHRIYSRYLSITRTKRLVDKYPELIFRVDYVRTLFPDAKIVFITRNGADVLPSVVKWSQQKGVNRNGVVEDWWGRGDIKWRYLREQIVLADKQYSPIWSVATEGLDHTNRAAIEWLTTMREGIAQHRRLPNQVIRIAYEDLLHNPLRELNELQRNCGLDPDPVITDYARRRLYSNPRRSWPTLHPFIEELFRETMTELGYTTPGTP